MLTVKVRPNEPVEARNVEAQEHDGEGGYAEHNQRQEVLQEAQSQEETQEGGCCPAESQGLP